MELGEGWVYVNSSQIKALRYLPENDIMEIRFNGKKGAAGPTYRYFGVSRTVFEELISAESIGKAFHAEVKSKFACKKEE
jgi:hypothetical protein